MVSKPVFFPHVDALRAVAVLSVFIYHLNPQWLPGGFSGVDIFFVISGFIVSASVGRRDGISFPRFLAFFYSRRIVRIVPALMVCLLLTTLACAVFVPNAWLSNANQRTGLFAFFGLSNYFLAYQTDGYFSPTAEYNPYTHTWSLGVEEQFYLIFPILFFLWARAASGRRTSLVLMTIAAILSVATAAYLASAQPTLAYYSIQSRFWQLAAGVLLYQAMALAGMSFETADAPRQRWKDALALAALGCLGYGFVHAEPATFPYPGAILTTLGAAGLLYSLHGSLASSVIGRVFTARPMLFTGKISYSLYLWHWPVFVLFRWTVGLDTPWQHTAAAGVAILLAAASYYLVERPVRLARLPKIAPRPVVLVAGIALVVGCAWSAMSINQAQPRLSISAVAQKPDDWYPYGSNVDLAHPECVLDVVDTVLNPGVVRTLTPRGCAVRPNAARVFVIGDSHALSYEAMFKAYAQQTGTVVTVYENGGCPFLSLQPGREASEHCVKSRELAIADMLERLAPGDIVFLPSLRLPRLADQWVQFDEKAVLSQMHSPATADERTRGVADALTILPRIAQRGAQIVFEAPTPIFRTPGYRCAEAYNRFNAICQGGTSMPREVLEAFRSPVIESQQKIVSALPSARIWDPFPVLCPAGETCSMFDQGRPLFFDADHVSGYANRLLLPSFLAMTRQVM